MLVPLPDLLSNALKGKYAVCYFEAWDIYSLEAVVEAAQAEGAPVILGFGRVMMDPEWFDSGGLDRLGALGSAAANAAQVPVSLLLNEISSPEDVVRGLCAGFNAFMLSTGHLPFAQNVQAVQNAASIAHAGGAAIEAELGRLPDSTIEGGSTAAFTDPDEAVRFVTETAIDALSVSVGNVHMLVDGNAEIDVGRMKAIRDVVTVPLVLHGGTGFPDQAIHSAIDAGVAKINIGTVLKRAFFQGVSEAVETSPAEDIDYQLVMGSRKPEDILQRGKQRMKKEVVRRIRLWRPGERTNETITDQHDYS